MGILHNLTFIASRPTSLTSGNAHPQERGRDLTDRYYTFEQALAAFIEDAAIAKTEKLMGLLQGRLFDGP